jgi:hypothetical protein
VKKISPNRFTFKNHCGSLGYSIFNLWDFDKHVPQKGWDILGYCKSENLQIRPRENSYAILLERIKKDDWGDDIGEVVWLHIRFLSNDDFKKYCDKTND